MDNLKTKKLTIALISSVLLFLIIRVGFGYGFNLMENASCLKYLGCTYAFFGFDILVHFASGIFEVTLILWLINRFPKLNILHDEFWKNVITLIAFAVLIGVVWEFWEFGVDHFRMVVLHQDLLYPRNLFMQTNNSDTMGDLIFGLLGSLSAIFSFRFLMPGFLNRKKPA